MNNLIYRWSPNRLLEAAHPEWPDDFSVLNLPSLLSMSGEELRHVAGVIDEARALQEPEMVGVVAVTGGIDG